MNFNVGDRVYADGVGEGIIVDFVYNCHGDNTRAIVSFETFGGGGMLPFSLSELRHIPKHTAKLSVYKQINCAVNVCVQNCTIEVCKLMHRLDIWKSTGRREYDENEPFESKYWFECPIEFVDFIKSDMGKECFKRMGVEEFYIES